MAKGKGKSNKLKIRNIESNRVRRIKLEIRKCEKKMEKLLRLYTEGKKRWKLQGGEKVETNKLQGIMPDGKRHKALLAHIEELKGKV